MNQYQATWNSLAQHRTPEWLKRAKFGIYTHWGPYAVPSYGGNGTWYPNRMYQPGTTEYAYHTRTYGPVDQFGYKDFIPMFTAEKYDADAWAELFAASGAKFAGPVAEHHDGFAMWDCKLNPYNAVNMGPKRDVVGELGKAIRTQGMKFIATFHHAYHWWFFEHGREYGECSDPAYARLYTRPHAKDEWPDEAYLNEWRDKVIEVIDAYQPDLLWFDFGLGRIRDLWRRQMLATYYNRAEAWGREVAVTYKQMPKGNYHLQPQSAVMDLEVGKMNTLTPYTWVTDTSIDAGPRGTWSHVRNIGFKSVERLVHNLVDRVSKNGLLLLNVGPRADGTIPEGAQDALRGIGKWLEVNGEAIFDTVPWVLAGEGPTTNEDGGHFNETNEPRFTAHDIRYTVNGRMLYAVCLGRPGDALTMSTFKDGHYLYPQDIMKITLLGHDQPLAWKLDVDGLTVDVPRDLWQAPAYAFKITLRA